MDENLNLQESGLNITPKSKKEEEKTYEELQAEVAALDEEKNPVVAEEVDDPDDLDKKNYVKITPTFYVQRVFDAESLEEEEEIFKILNPETGVVEKRPLTDGEKREIYIKELKDSRIRFKNSIHNGNITITKFGSDYKQKRKRRNKLAKASRKANR